MQIGVKIISKYPILGKCIYDLEYNFIMTKSIIAIFAMTSILFAAFGLIQNVYGGEQSDRIAADNPLTNTIPDWIDQSFIWYAEKQISQTELINSLEFLVKEEIILLPSTVPAAEAQEITTSIEELQLKIETIENDIEKIGKAEIIQIEDDDQLQMKLIDEFKKAEMAEFDENPIPAGAMTTYVKYKKGVLENLRLTVECDKGDVATGGGFAPSINLAYEHNYISSMPYPENYANNPRMNNPTGWTYMGIDSGEARVWVVCLDLTPSTLSAQPYP